MDILYEQMFILLILKTFKQYSNPSLVYSWFRLTAEMIGLPKATMSRLLLGIMQKQYDWKQLESAVYTKLYDHGVSIRDIMKMTGRSESYCYKLLKHPRIPYTLEFPKDKDFIKKALRKMQRLGGNWY